MPADLAERILADCRGAVGEVRFGFGSKRQVWAFEERHQLDVAALAAELARSDWQAFLDLAIAFHDEFASVNNSWRIRDHIQALVADLARGADAALAEAMVAALVDDRLALRHWLTAAFIAAPPLVAFRGLEDALARAYQPQDQWALLARLRALAEAHDLGFGPESAPILAELAQFSARPEDRSQALELLARFGRPAAKPVLTRASLGDADASVRALALRLLGS